jgi:hypothetical protein
MSEVLPRLVFAGCWRVLVSLLLWLSLFWAGGSAAQTGARGVRLAPWLKPIRRRMMARKGRKPGTGQWLRMVAAGLAAVAALATAAGGSGHGANVTAGGPAGLCPAASPTTAQLTRAGTRKHNFHGWFSCTEANPVVPTHDLRGNGRRAVRVVVAEVSVS